MTDDRSNVSLDFLERLMEKKKSEAFDGGGGGNHIPPMEARIAVLEHRAEEAAKRMDAMDAKLDRILEKVAGLPTTNGLWGMVATVIGVALAMVAITFSVAEWVAAAPPA
jgi:hypothetical protein